MEREIYTFTSNCITNASIETLLDDVLEVAKNQGFSRIVTHSLRSVTSEILSNIVSHAYLKDDERSITMSIFTTNEKTIHISTKNFIPNEDVGTITIWLNKINLLSHSELKELQRKTLEDSLDKTGSPRIGLIMIRRNTCKPIICKFEPYNDDISYISLDLEISLNIQEDLKKEKTKRTPQVNFDIPNQLFEISGLSFPENAEDYYSEIEQWIDEHEQYISELQNPIIKIDLDYFNSISLKNIVRTIRALLATNPDKFSVNWYYDVDDEISHEEGIEMSEILHKKFNFIEKN